MACFAIKRVEHQSLVAESRSVSTKSIVNIQGAFRWYSSAAETLVTKPASEKAGTRSFSYSSTISTLPAPKDQAHLAAANRARRRLLL
jgi:hypothetical protein